MATFNKYVSHGTENNGQYRQFEEVLELDGSNDYTLFPNTITLNSSPNNLLNIVNTNNNYAISYWIKSGDSLNGGIGNGVPYIYFLSYTGATWLILGNTYFIYAQNAAVVKGKLFSSSTPSTGLNKWLHIVGVKSSNTTSTGMKLYINGLDMDMYPTTIFGENYITPLNVTIPQAFAGNVIGGSLQGVSPPYTQAPTAYYPAKVAELIILNTAITPQEIRQLYNRGTNVKANYTTNYPANVMNNRVLHYSFHPDDYVGTTVTDLSGNGNHATVFGQAGSVITNPFY